MHICDLSNYCFLVNHCYCSILYIIHGHYSLFVRASVYGISYNLIEEGVISDIIHVCDLSFDFQLGNMFYCSVLIMVQGYFLEVLEAIA
jgi:hypothetical protein